MEIMYLLVISLFVCLFLLTAMSDKNGLIAKLKNILSVGFVSLIYGLIIANLIHCVMNQLTFNYNIDFYNWYVVISYTLFIVWTLYIIESLFRFSRYKQYFKENNSLSLIDFGGSFEKLLNK